MSASKQKNSLRDIEKNAVDMSVLEDRLGYKIRMLDRIVGKEFYSNVGMTSVQYSVFTLVATNENLSQVAIGEALGMDRASTMAIVHKLESAGLLEKRTSPHDRRMHALQLTAKGKREYSIVDKKVAEYDNRFKDRLTETELANFYKYANKIFNG